MNLIRFLKLNLTFLIINLIKFFPVSSTSPTTDTRENSIIGIQGGTIMAEDPLSGMTVALNYPVGALKENTEIILILHGTKLPGILAKSHIKGITILPKSLFFQEKVTLEIYNPPVEVTNRMILNRIENDQFIIPLGNQIPHIDENYTEGTFYITGQFSFGTPTPAEVKTQCSKLAAYNPAQLLSCAGGDDSFIQLQAKYALNEFPDQGGPFTDYSGQYLPLVSCPFIIDEECLRWQKALTKIEAIMTWIEFHQRNGNTSAENAEKRNAEKALQETIDGCLNKPSPSNRCGSYIKVAAKYPESAILFGMDTGGSSGIAKHFNQLFYERSFVFSVETHEWINHLKETFKDGAWSEEKSNVYTTLKCYEPWNEFLFTGTQKVWGEGVSSINYENHCGGDEKEDHHSITGSWNVEKIEGAIQQYVDDHGEQTMLANISIYLKKNVTPRIWGKYPQDTFDESRTDARSFMEHKSYPLENGYSEKIGNERSGKSIRVFILKSPGDGRDDPVDCFLRNHPHIKIFKHETSKANQMLFTGAFLSDPVPDFHSAISARENFENQCNALKAKFENEEPEPRFTDNNDIEVTSDGWE